MDKAGHRNDPGESSAGYHKILSSENFRENPFFSEVGE
jgi:hypothetical protein